jgi:probable F420-dependent oxidoreductase
VSAPPRRPFRFGVFAEGVRSQVGLAETARRAEDGGFATFLIRDHFIAEPFGDQLAPLASLATVAAATTRLRVGSLVFANDYRHPALLAKEIATLDLLSEGRVELGLGAGFSRAEYARAGIPFDPPEVRVERLAEAIRILKGLFAGGPVTFAGKHYTITGLEGFPTPVQRPHPPILLGGAGARMLALAAREADIVGLQTVSTAGGVVTEAPAVRSAETVLAKIGRLRELAGERFARLELSAVASVVVADGRRAAAERFARERGWAGLSADAVLAMPSVFVGSVDSIVEQMRDRRERYGFSYYVVLDRAMAHVAPVVARLAGA